MPNSPSSSFIPKQGPAKHSRQAVSRQVYLFTVVSYVLFFATLAGSVGVFLYHSHIKKQLDSEVAALNGEIGSFSDVKMEQVRSFNMRLKQTAERVGNSVSGVAVLEALEAAAVETVVIDSLKMKRVADQTFELTAEITTDSFDSSLFQRGVYERSPIVESVSIQDLGLADEEQSESSSGSARVAFKALLQVPLEAVPYQVQNTSTESVPAVQTELSRPSSTAAVINPNENNL